MRGDFLHNRVLLAPLQRVFAQYGWETRHEAFLRQGPRTGYIDLLAWKGGKRLAIEAELTPRRVTKDLWKAQVVQATELWIVVPNGAVARRVRKACGARTGREPPRFFVLTQGQSIQRLTHYVSSFPMSNDGDKNQK